MHVRPLGFAPGRTQADTKPGNRDVRALLYDFQIKHRGDGWPHHEPRRLADGAIGPAVFGDVVLVRDLTNHHGFGRRSEIKRVGWQREVTLKIGRCRPVLGSDLAVTDPRFEPLRLTMHESAGNRLAIKIHDLPAESLGCVRGQCGLSINRRVVAITSGDDRCVKRVEQCGDRLTTAVAGW